MKSQCSLSGGFARVASIAAGLFLGSMLVQACTIFVLTDTNRALFCNNEDWSDTNTRIWFMPAGEGYYGAAYVGFNNGWAQGGLNTEGLAFDWVAGYSEKWAPGPELSTVRGNPSQRMLETCATVEDAIKFYRTHREPSFSSGRILVADRSGASVIIGAKDGKLDVEQENQCRGFGYGQRPLDAALAKHPEPTVTDGFKILRDCRQTGEYATKYSNIYDMKSGDIFLYPFPAHDDEVKLNLTAELNKGAHYYDMPEIKEELAQAPRPLALNMERFPIDEFKPIPDREPEITDHFRVMIDQARDGVSRFDDYTVDLWKQVAPQQQQIQSSLKALGDLGAMTLVDRSETNRQHSYRYRLEFSNATVLQHVVFSGENKLAASDSESVEWKPGKNPEESTPSAIVGIGVILRLDGEKLIINGTVPGSPAAAHRDIHAGDRILAVAQETGEAVPVQSSKLAQAVALIRGPLGTIVRLTIASPLEDDSHARVVSFERAEVKVPGQ